MRRLKPEMSRVDAIAVSQTRMYQGRTLLHSHPKGIQPRNVEKGIKTRNNHESDRWELYGARKKNGLQFPVL